MLRQLIRCFHRYRKISQVAVVYANGIQVGVDAAFQFFQVMHFKQYI